MVLMQFIWVALGVVSVSLLVGACGLLALVTERDFPLVIGIVWSLLAFIGTIALAKHLEGRPFDD